MQEMQQTRVCSLVRKIPYTGKQLALSQRPATPGLQAPAWQETASPGAASAPYLEGKPAPTTGEKPGQQRRPSTAADRRADKTCKQLKPEEPSDSGERRRGRAKKGKELSQAREGGSRVLHLPEGVYCLSLL